MIKQISTVIHSSFIDLLNKEIHSLCYSSLGIDKPDQGNSSVYDSCVINHGQSIDFVLHGVFELCKPYQGAYCFLIVSLLCLFCIILTHSYHIEFLVAALHAINTNTINTLVLGHLGDLQKTTLIDKWTSCQWAALGTHFFIAAMAVAGTTI